jgi:hypothetical protein
MNDKPIKIIWKYKNLNRKVQYDTYIFIGQVNIKIINILNKIKKLSLYDSFIKLDIHEIKILIEEYGDLWYKYFFNNYHIEHTFETIKMNNVLKNNLIKKYDDKWYNETIINFKQKQKKIPYSYESNIKNLLSQKKVTLTQFEKNINIDYTTTDKIKKNENQNTQQLSNQNEEDDDALEKKLVKKMAKALPINSRNLRIINDKDNEIDDEQYNENLDNDEQNINEEEEKNEEEFDMDSIDDIFKNVDVNIDEENSKTSNIIKKFMEEEKDYNESKKMIPFNNTKNNIDYNEEKKNAYTKEYVTNQFIYMEDTIKIIKDKICVSLSNNEIFGKQSYLMPSRQYLWFEYNINEIIHKIMLGHSWKSLSELLKIDIEPNNNLSVYELLNNNLRLLKYNLKKYNNKIRREDEDDVIIHGYNEYMTNNDIYMIDIYNELGKNYNKNAIILNDIYDVYVKIYFPKISQEQFKNIINYLNNDNKIEQEQMILIKDIIHNDVTMENEIVTLVEHYKKNINQQQIIQKNYITQSVIQVIINTTKNTNIDLYRIFNNFIVNKDYPFIQYRTSERYILYKYKESSIKKMHNENNEILKKWFEHTSYGISFKIKIDKNSKLLDDSEIEIEKNKDSTDDEQIIEKYIAINLNNNNRIEYKTQWKELYKASYEDINDTHEYVKKLLNKINKEQQKINIKIPTDEDFKFAFLNSIYKYDTEYNINHNDLSEFSRYFYPYVALVIEPRKRLSNVKKKKEELSKYGTYLRYKKVNKYDNIKKLEQRILYYMRNYEFTENQLSLELSKQFNITENAATEEIDRVKNKYPKIKKSRKILKKLENLPKFKPPGIGIDIQGKHKDKYKIRISGARDKEQMDRIIIFVNVLLKLYEETYILKQKDKQILKQKLKTFVNIAKRRNKVFEIVNFEENINAVKKMTNIDKRRLGFKPNKGQNQWTRSCQNSGNNKKRRPQQFNTKNFDTLLNKEYVLDKKTGDYIRLIKQPNGTFIKLRAVKLKEYDENGKDSNNYLYYTCNPEENQKHTYVGFLTKSRNPYGQCMPCCFKKSQYDSDNDKKKQLFDKCLNQKNDSIMKNTIGDILYILQYTNKIQPKRLSFLPNMIDVFLNNDRKINIKNNYLVDTHGYYLKMGITQDNMSFINSIIQITNISIEEIKQNIKQILKKDKNESIFMSLKDGDIKTKYKTIDAYCEYISSTENLTYNSIVDILEIPNVLYEEGLNIIIFNKSQIDENNDGSYDILLNCINIDKYYNLKNKKRKNALFIKDNGFYFPILLIKKLSENTKNLIFENVFNNEQNNIISKIILLYKSNCNYNLFKSSKYTAKYIQNKLIKLNNEKYLPKYQIIDIRHKCKFLITKDDTIIPVYPSGIIFDVKIENKMLIYSFDENFKKLKNLYNESIKKLKKPLPYEPIGVYYDSFINNIYSIFGIMTESNMIIPIIKINMHTDDIKNKKLLIEKKISYGEIDDSINKNMQLIDKRIFNINYDNFFNESYELFKLELSNYFFKNNAKKIIFDIIANDNLSKNDKIVVIKLLLFKIINQDLYAKYLLIHNDYFKNNSNIDNMKNFKYNIYIDIVDEIDKLKIESYVLNNDRLICNDMNKNQCSLNAHCFLKENKCHMQITHKMAIIFINKISMELITNELKYNELLQIDDYYVSDIVNYNYYTDRPDQVIIKSNINNTKIDKILHNIFGNDVPIIGSKFLKNQLDYVLLNQQNKIIKYSEYFVQNVMYDNISIFRAYANCYYWFYNKFYIIDKRNLGYVSTIQNDLSYYFRGEVISWLTNKKNDHYITKMKINVNEHINNMTENILELNDNGLINLFVLNNIHNIPIIIYNNKHEIIYIIDNDIIDKHILKVKDTYLSNAYKYFNIMYNYSDLNVDIDSNIPNNIYVIHFNV